MAVSKYSGNANAFQRSLNVLFLKQQSNQRNEVLGLFLFFIHVFHTFRWMAQAIAEKKFKWAPCKQAMSSKHKLQCSICTGQTSFETPSPEGKNRGFCHSATDHYNNFEGRNFCFSIFRRNKAQGCFGLVFLAFFFITARDTFCTYRLVLFNKINIYYATTIYNASKS